ncbi:Cell division cycle protein 48 [Phytophthora cinnamomi]|uniref:Cell division cycle protein 48 n=1 Tax=Phytophthora cinnamomi TaxID=4785 RepID=UPI00355A5597|nr:Cell division cycle protein 48 [Phytophthora cinnamomi]
MATTVEAVVGGAASAVATARDERCVLYSAAVQCSHEYVRVANGERVAFAQLRGAAATSSLSFGLAEALQLSSNAEGQRVTLRVQPAGDEELATGGTKCNCRCGVVASVRVEFLARTRPPSAVARGLQRIAAKLLDGAVVWSGRRSSVTWLNRRDAVRFAEVEWESAGSGCCQQFATVSSTSTVELRFVGDEQPKGALKAAAFQPVDVYVGQVARELGGVDKYARSLLLTILQRLGPPEQEGVGTVKPSVGALVSGLPGIGKTALAQAICKCIGVKTIFLNAADIFQTYVGQSEKQLVKIFESAVLQAPCVLLIDGIEAIAGSRRALADSQSALEIGVLGALLSSLEKIKASSHRVYVLSTTTRPGDVDAAVLSNGSRTKLQLSLASDEARMDFLKQHVVILASTTHKELLDPAILRPGRFDVHIHVDFPDEDARREIIFQALEEVPVNYSDDPVIDSREALAIHLAKRTAGLSAGDVNAILREAAMASMRDDLQATAVSINNTPVCSP